MNSENCSSQNNSNTNRAVFNAFCMTLKESNVPTVGGVPQLMDMYRGFNSIKVFGYIDEDKNFFVNGCPAENTVPVGKLSKIQWHNSNFENMNPFTRELIEGAQHQTF